MMLKSPKHMAELFAVINKLLPAQYQDNELNEVCNNALLLKKHKQSILALDSYSMKKFLTAILAVSFAVSLAACNSVQENGDDVKTDSSSSYSSTIHDSPADIHSLATSNETISEDDIETVKRNYSSEDRRVYDAQIIDLNFDGKSELLVLTQQANPKVLEVWEKSGGKMNCVCSFGAGKVNFIDVISFKEGKVNDEKVYLFSFAYDEGNDMKADEVLSAVRKTADGYDVEHLLSRGTITYPDIAEPFTKEFYRKGWSKRDIGLDQDYDDISKEEYDRLRKEYTG